MTLAEIAASSAAPCTTTPAYASPAPAFVDSRAGRARRAVRGVRRRARRRPRLRRRRGRGGRAAVLGPARVGAPGRGRRRPASPRSAGWPGTSLAPAARPHRRRDHRLPGQDHHQGPARPGARQRRADGGARRVVQQRARPAAHGAAGRRPTPGSWSSRWGPGARRTSATCAAIAPPARRRSCSTSARPTSASSARQEAIAAAKGELVEALAADGVAVLNADDPLVLVATCLAHMTIGSRGRCRYSDHAACPSAHRTCGAPARISRVRLVRKPVVFSPGMSPRYDATLEASEIVRHRRALPRIAPPSPGQRRGPSLTVACAHPQGRGL